MKKELLTKKIDDTRLSAEVAIEDMIELVENNPELIKDIYVPPYNEELLLSELRKAWAIINSF